MSRDIRSYFFTTNNTSKPKQPPDSPQGKKRNRRVIESDDENDEDVFQSKKKTKEQPAPPKAKTVEKKKQETVIDVENFFGKKPVQQKPQTVVPKKPGEGKRKSPRKSKKGEKKDSCEVTFENDDELEASFMQTDVEDLLSSVEKEKDDSLVVIEERKKTPRKEEKKSTPRKEERKGTPKKEDRKSTPKKEDRKSTPKKEEKKKTPKKEVILDVKPNKTPKQERTETDNMLWSSEQKRRSSEAYQKYLNRSGPKNPGSKAIPQGTPTCLRNLTFVITGVLDSLEREEAVDLVKKCGGRVTSSVSKKTDYVVVGEEPGVSKIQKAESFGTKKLSEDELLELIRRKSGGAESEKDCFIEGTPEKDSRHFRPEEVAKTAKRMEEWKKFREPAEGSVPPKKVKEAEKEADKTKPVPVPEAKRAPSTSKALEIESVKSPERTEDILWVDKYKPKSTKNIIGQTGEKSNVKKLTKWLQDWHRNHSSKKEKKTRPAPWAQNDDGSYFKAALLSGPPGVGKTTTIQLICQELGLDIIEFNASDTRSKKLLQEEVAELLSSKTIRGFCQGSGDSFQKKVLVMDEVDGMAGNEDRGGVQELIQLIKTTKVPIVGICNDRNHQKIRTLANYCFDLRFQRPRVEQIKGAMKSICFKEKLDIPGEALEELIIASNHDVRQVLHNLSVLASGEKALTVEEAKKKGAQAKKPLNLSAWDVTRKVFSASEQEKMSFSEKMDLFFQDYNLGPLFIQDTYIRVKPYKAKNCEKKTMELIAKAADSLAKGDVIEKAIRTHNAWSLLPVQAVFSSVLPGYYMSGHVQGQIQFPAWLGKNSRANKLDRLLQDLHTSLRISISGDKDAVNLDYLSSLKREIVQPLVEKGMQGVQDSVEFMRRYHLTKDDLESILELSAWPGVKDTYSDVDPKVKAALTRALNKEGQVVVASRKGTKTKGESDEFGLEEGEEEAEEGEKDTIDLDPMIKVGKPKGKKEAGEKPKKVEKKPTTKKETKKGKR